MWNLHHPLSTPRTSSDVTTPESLKPRPSNGRRRVNRSEENHYLTTSPPRQLQRWQCQTRPNLWMRLTSLRMITWREQMMIRSWNGRWGILILSSLLGVEGRLRRGESRDPDLPRSLVAESRILPSKSPYNNMIIFLNFAVSQIRPTIIAVNPGWDGGYVEVLILRQVLD